MPRIRRLVAASAFIGAALLATTAADSAAQRATGNVADRATGEPVGLAVVALIDSAGARLQQVLTASDGAFVMNVPPGGPFRLRVERIGYHAVDSAPFLVEVDTDRFFPLRVEAQPIALAGIEASGEQTCAINSSAGEILSVWTEARKALSAASAAERGRVFSFSGFAYTRRVDPNDVVVSRNDRPYANRWSQPFRGLPAADLIGDGYVRPDDEGVTYYAPSADVLLSPEFEEVNCFALRRSRTDPDLIGVSFAPNRRYRLPTVAGTAWLDNRTMHLRFVEFGYVNVESIPFANHASGRVEFRMLPNGGWLVSRWSIRMPSNVRQTRAGDFAASSILLYVEEGGEVMTAVAGGQRFAIGAVGALTGSVIDSTASQPLAGALVRLDNTAFAGRTDAEGRFQMNAVPEGRYTVSFEHPRLDSLPAYARAPVNVDVSIGTTAHVDLAIAPLARSTLASCNTRPNRTAVYGSVRDSFTGRPLPDARILLEWDSVIVNRIVFGAARRGRDIEPGSDGRYLACDVPFDRIIQATVELGGHVMLRETFVTNESPTFQTFDVDTRRPISADTDTPLYCRSVVDSAAGERVVLKGSDRCTGARGRCGDPHATG